MPSQGHSFAPSRKQHPVEPDSPMPAGFFKRLHARTLGRGEKRLAAAVLEDAVHTFQKHRAAKDYHSKVLYWEAETWFASRERRSLFSFENVCSILGLRSTDIRRLLQRWLDRRMDGFSQPAWYLGPAGAGMRLASTGPEGVFPLSKQVSPGVEGVNNEPVVPLDESAPDAKRDGLS